MLLLAVVFASKEPPPNAVLYEPVVFAPKAFQPPAAFSVPVVLASIEL